MDFSLPERMFYVKYGILHFQNNPAWRFIDGRVDALSLPQYQSDFASSRLVHSIMGFPQAGMGQPSLCQVTNEDFHNQIVNQVGLQLD